MSIKKVLKNWFTFKEPQAEPGFVLAWDEPEELEGTKKKAETFQDEECLINPDQKPTGDLNSDLRIFTELFGKNNPQVEVRRFQVGSKDLAVVFVPHMVDAQTVSTDIIGVINTLKDKNINLATLNAEITANPVEPTGDFNHGLNRLLQGSSLIFIAGETQFICVGTESHVQRQVTEPINERVTRGPQVGFIEDLETNLALIRQRLRTPHLVIETVIVGTLSRTRVAILSVNNITNSRLLKEVKRRIQGLKIDHLVDSGMLEQLIEDSTIQPYPQLLTTERPDRVAVGLSEGRVAVLVDGSNLVLVMPATIPGLLHQSEDYNVRWPYGIYLRTVRNLALFAILFLPPLYVAVNLYQPDLIPTDLLFSIIAIKQRSPFPTIIEVLILELVFDILREANFRAPRSMAGPISIITGILFGLLSVTTNIINPILLIVIMVTALAVFTMPDYSVSLGLRLTRYFYIFLAFIFGYTGIVFGAFCNLLILVNQKSFGVPMFAPIAPFTKRSKDIILMSPVSSRIYRPDFLDPQQVMKKPDQQPWQKEQTEKPYAPEGGETDD